MVKLNEDVPSFSGFVLHIHGIITWSHLKIISSVQRASPWFFSRMGANISTSQRICPVPMSKVASLCTTWIHSSQWLEFRIKTLTFPEMWKLGNNWISTRSTCQGNIKDNILNWFVGVHFHDFKGLVKALCNGNVYSNVYDDKLTLITICCVR